MKYEGNVITAVVLKLCILSAPFKIHGNTNQNYCDVNAFLQQRETNLCKALENLVFILQVLCSIFKK